jgi:hypothetical protein
MVTIVSTYIHRYKDLVSVYRHPKTEKIAVASKIYRIERLEGSGSLFPNGSPHSFCYVIADQKKGNIKFWYNAFVPFW